MLNLPKMMIDRLVSEVETAYKQNYGSRSPLVGDIITWCSYLALENIANSDALYHNMDHTVMVTLVGQSLLQGKLLLDGSVTPEDWLHVTMALLCHDIGYVRGVCHQDNGNCIATGIGDETVTLPPGLTDAALSPYHVDRSKLFVKERFNQPRFVEVDTNTIISYIEMTRFPIPTTPFYQQTNDYAGLVRAADFIGQLGDPNYLRKIPALYYELEEVDKEMKIGYNNLDDMRHNYARFYWDVVSPYIQEALDYLRVTQEGKQWIANLHSHVFDVEHRMNATQD